MVAHQWGTAVVSAAFCLNINIIKLLHLRLLLLLQGHEMLDILHGSSLDMEHPKKLQDTQHQQPY